MNRQFCVILVVLSLALAFAADQKQETYLKDRSDWWSLLNESLLDRELEPREKSLAADNFAIAGVSLNEDPLPQLAAKLGEPVLVKRGDASTGRSQACYVSLRGSTKTHLIFERGEVEYSFYLFVGGADWNGSNQCVKSELVSSDVRTPSGLRLGLSRSDLEAILGKPDLIQADKVIYVRGAKKKTTPRVLASLRNDYPAMSDEQFHQNYDYCYQWTYVEARLVDSRVSYLAVSKSETF